MTIIDVGANVGYYIVKWGDMVGPEGRALAIEANPASARLLRENVALNCRDGRCKIQAVAAGTQKGPATLWVPMGSGRSGFSLKVAGSRDMMDIEFAVMAFDQLFPI